jgi:hypothetical protein
MAERVAGVRVAPSHVEIAPGTVGLITTCLQTCPIIEGIGTICYAIGDFFTCPSVGVSVETRAQYR